MRRLHGTAIWTAGLSAATATGCFVAFVFGAIPRSQALFAAELAVATGVAALLVSVAVDYLLTLRQPRTGLSLLGAGGKPSAVDCSACLHKRREVLDVRLEIDEPRVCSQYMIRCTCWSFCGEAKSERSVVEAERCITTGTSPAAQALVRMRNLLSEAKVPPLVHRNGIENCPFRFKSPYARRAPADGVTPGSFESGTATG